ncbi:uncharacterized protein E0L32_011915 [Thyridium curvatum]|uniref:N-acetyltransferase domain-containing protein n=1 Tax=Thyridium curvatum TaxID=1093900 RepID=A0A507BGU6_9PEZI|nr:uncharacterized protein E0L32_011915 [Thyridium curvatum]TPX18004.1 hypothetical protein E0L32_011915 [Thyridium curvatum]
MASQGTPFVALLEPSNLDGYDPKLPRSEQPPSIPATFLDAMEVRQRVFVEEQKVPADAEFDQDDARCCHFVVYASVNQTVEPEERDAAGNVVKPRRSESRSQPVGTVRIVPFPHPPHPDPGAAYAMRDGSFVRIGTMGEDGTVVPADSERGQREVGEEDALPNFVEDRRTTFHDGKEPYVKLGRLAVVKEYRRHKLGRLLVTTALEWMREHPTYFNPSVATMGFEQLGIDKASDIPKFNGLVCAHAQTQASTAWKMMGFVVDEGMGSWWEEGIEHVGMFKRLQVTPEQPLPV